MLARIESAGVHGIDAHRVEIEVHQGRGLPGVAVVGLPDTAVKESRERVRSAVQNSGYEFPFKRLTVNLAPADVKKEGPAYDLPIALGILAASEQTASARFPEYALVGELALDGTVRPVHGILSMALYAREAGLKGLICPAENAREAALVEGIEAIPVSRLPEAVGFLSGGAPVAPARTDVRELFAADGAEGDLDFAEVRGQALAKRALTIAAAGNHNLLMIGPPGAGKTMLARRLPTILPPLTLEEALEATRIHSVAGGLPPDRPLLTARPFRAPHHTISDIGLVGGGTFPRPGEVSLAHRGVLFLDELPEFDRSALEVLRQPLEDGSVTIARAQASAVYPAELMLVAAMNPCPCGFLGDRKRMCRCAPGLIRRYRARVSGPLLDRVDLHVEVPAISYGEMASARDGESSAAMRERVLSARRIQAARGGKARRPSEAPFTNGRMTGRQVKRFCALGAEAEALLGKAMESLGLSARAYTRILKVARTIADLDGSEAIAAPHVAEAVQLRCMDRGMI